MMLHVCCSPLPHLLPRPLPAPSQLNERMILRGVGLPWELGYSTFRDGISLHTLYRRLGEYEDCPNVLVVRDEGGTVSGEGEWERGREGEGGREGGREGGMEGWRCRQDCVGIKR